MGFEALLGNHRLKENLKSAMARGRVSHFYLISGPQGSGKHTLARLLAAAMVCTGEQKPCGLCAGCRKALSGNHPDFITVDDPEKKNVPVELIRQARSDVFVRPNEAQRKVYLFPRGQDMRVEAQNALLKVLEEPPSYGVFLVLSDNPEKLLPTVRSRCVELAMEPLDAATLKRELARRFPNAQPEELAAAALQSGGFLGQAQELLSQEADPQDETFLQAFARRDSYAMAQVLVPMEKTKRDVLIPKLQRWSALLQNALLQRSGAGIPTAAARTLAASRQPGDLLAGVEALEQAAQYAMGNVSPGAICGWLLWELTGQSRQS